CERGDDHNVSFGHRCLLLAPTQDRRARILGTRAHSQRSTDCDAYAAVVVHPRPSPRPSPRPTEIARSPTEHVMGRTTPSPFIAHHRRAAAAEARTFPAISSACG